MEKNTKKLQYAKKLRSEMTNEEKLLWSVIKSRKFYGIKFRRQVPFGDYIADFLSYEQKIIIELDGGQHNEFENIQYDEKRTKYFELCGYKVIRFWNNEIRENLEGVYEKLKEECGVE